MKYYSQMLNKLFDTQADLILAEKKTKEAEAQKIAEEQTKKEQRTKRAKEVEEALKAAEQANAKAMELLRKFTQDYGSFHMSYTKDDVDKKDTTKPLDFIDLLSSFII